MAMMGHSLITHLDVWSLTPFILTSSRLRVALVPECKTRTPAKRKLIWLQFICLLGICSFLGSFTGFLCGYYFSSRKCCRFQWNHTSDTCYWLLVHLSNFLKYFLGVALNSLPVCICVFTRRTPKAETLQSVPSWSTVRTLIWLFGWASSMPTRDC